MMKLDKKAIFCILIGLLLSLLGLFLVIWSPVELALYDRLSMRPGTLPYEAWTDPLTKNVIIKIYIFNVTNSEEFLSGEDPKLNLTEIGPIYFHEVIIQTNTTFNENGTLTYESKRIPQYAPELNTIDLNETVTIPNWGILGAASIVTQNNFFMKMMFNILLGDKAQLFLRLTLSEILWECKEPFLISLKKQNMAPTDNIAILPMIYRDHLDSTVTVFIGPSNGHEKFFTFDNIDGVKTLPHFGNTCNETLEGVSEGILFSQHITKDTKVYFYKRNVCKPYMHLYESETSYFGINALKFTLLNSTYDRTDPLELDCFRGEPVLPSGLLDISKCYFEIPIATSHPHFLYTDETLRNCVNGMAPDEEKHKSSFIIEPYTGIPIDFKISIQVNMFVRKLVATHKSLNRFSDQIIPMFWIEVAKTDFSWENSPAWMRMVYFLTVLLPVIQIVLNTVFILSGFLIIIWAVKQQRIKHVQNLTKTVEVKSEEETKKFLAGSK